MDSLKGKVALITGASEVLAQHRNPFAECGAHLALNYFKHEAEASDCVARARSYGIRAIAIQADVSRFDDVRGVVRAHA